MRSLSILSLLMCPLSWSAPLLQLSPASGVLSGAPGSTVGWGFTITNTMNFLEVTGSDFCEGAIVSPCPHSIGSYTDFIGQFNFVVVGPAPESASVTQAFNLAAMTGAGSFHINSSGRATGQIVVSYDLFSRSPNDPNFNPVTDTVSTGNRLTAQASVTAVPEPATWALLSSTSILACVGLRRRKF